MRTRVIRTFLTSGFIMAALALLAVDFYAAQTDPTLWHPLLILTGIILASGGILAYIFVRSFSRQTAELRSYAESMLDPLASGEQLPAGNDDLGDLARTLQRTAPRIRELVETLKLESSRRDAFGGSGARSRPPRNPHRRLGVRRSHGAPPQAARRWRPSL